MNNEKKIFKALRAFMKNVGEDEQSTIKTMESMVTYLAEKVRVYEEIYKTETGKERISLNTEQKKRLACCGRKVPTALLSEVEADFKPDTIYRWYNELVANKYNGIAPGQKKRGRKTVSKELEELIIHMAEHNRNWGYKRIAEYLVYLGYDISFTTVKRILNRNGIYTTGPHRGGISWTDFYAAHQHVIAACDFATYELATENGLVREHILFFENIATREIWLGGIKHEPNGKYMTQVAKNQCDAFDGKLLNMEFLVHDRDPLFAGVFPDVLRSVGCTVKKIPPKAPECNAYIESFIKTIKRECLSKLVLTSEAQLRYVVQQYIEYYNRERPHRGLDGNFINPWPQDPDGEVREFTRLGGLLKSYRRVKCAA